MKQENIYITVDKNYLIDRVISTLKAVGLRVSSVSGETRLITGYIAPNKFSLVKNISGISSVASEAPIAPVSIPAPVSPQIIPTPVVAAPINPPDVSVS